MSETLERVDPSVALAAAHAALDALHTLDLTPCSDEQLTTVLIQTERLRRRLEVVDHAQILDLERRGIAARTGARTVARLLAGILHLDPGEARARHRAAEAAGSRRSLLGEPLPPAYPLVAAAQADGTLSARHARIITRCVETLPDKVKHEGPGVEERLVGFARDLHLSPHELAVAAQHEVDWLDPDGKYRDLEHRRTTRDLTVHVRPDGSCTLRGEGTAELAAFLQTTFDALAAPTPAAGGVLATVILTMNEQAYKTGQGFARTGHGAQVPVREAMAWAGGDYRLFTTVLNSVREVIAYSTCHRFYSENQRLVFIARDGGCAFPGCDAPPAWTQAHHIVEWQDSHRTSVDAGCLLCGYHPTGSTQNKKPIFT